MYIFTPNTLIRSSEVNANFDELTAGNWANPYMFRAYPSADDADEGVMICNIVSSVNAYDLSSGMNTSTGEYTIPVAGYWTFTASANFYNAGSLGIATCTTSIQYDQGTSTWVTRSSSYFRNNAGSGTTVSQAGITIPTTTTMYCLAGSKVRVFTTLFGTGLINADNTQTYFEGRLVSA